MDGPNVVDWVMACVESAEYYVVLNGKGDGFFRPGAGLRQGCTLSPYLFTMGINGYSLKEFTIHGARGVDGGGQVGTNSSTSYKLPICR